MSCQSAHQLARFAAENPDIATFQKGPFDWLICPPDSAVSWLESRLETPQTSDFTIRRDKPYWPRHDLYFWHGYTWRDGDVRKLDINRTAAREAEKLAYQREQFLTLDPANTIFVVSNTQNNLAGDVFDQNEAEKYLLNAKRLHRLKSALDATFTADTRLALITRSDRLDGPLTESGKIIEIEPGDSEWKGENTAWDNALKGLLGS
ncbi:MAG: hypothetical protein AAF764_04495 [Pseudomonadota bacterium]